MASEPDATTVCREVMGHVPSGIQVLTLRDDAGAPRGMTVSSLTPVTYEPPSVLMCIGEHASMRPTLTEGRMVALNLLGPSQAAHSAGFAYGDADPFETFGWHDGPESLPLIDGAAATLIGRIERVEEHHGTGIVFIAVSGGGVDDDGTLVYWKRSYFGDLTPAPAASGGSW